MTLGLAPIAPLLDTAGPVAVDAISGVSGAGRAASERTHFCNVSVAPYAPLTHRHAPEIRRHAGVDVAFVPHLGPFDRGILATMHATLAPGVGLQAVRDALGVAWSGESFVHLLPDGMWPSIGAVQHTNRCDIAVTGTGRHVVVISAIDNLLKGAAGQALQCLNLVLGLDETTGLPREHASCTLA